MIATAIRQIFNAADRREARERLAEVVDRLRAPAPKVARLLEHAAEELARVLLVPARALDEARSTNPLERVNKEIGRRSDVVGIYPNDRALIRLAGMLLIEQNDEWLVQRRYLSEHSMRLVLSPRPVQNNRSEQQQQGGDRPQRRLSTQRSPTIRATPRSAT